VTFAEKRVVVTGAGSGMGRDTALAFGRLGASVLAADLDGDAATQTVDAIREDGGTGEAHRMDLRRRDEVFGMVDAAVQRFGGVDVLVNAAGTYPVAAVADTSEELWDEVFAVDLKGPLFACQAVLPHMERSGGVIVNVASGAAFYGIRGLAAYSAAKAGLVALGRVVALEAGHGIRVNTVVPGPTATPGTQPLEVPPEPPPGMPKIPRWLDPTEIADVIVWVASDAARSVNGAILRVDGGHYML
jgi:NAD(P)-dependent dehydrogenase (short-subunit alcohol dehydrogenase family)